MIKLPKLKNLITDEKMLYLLISILLIFIISFSSFSEKTKMFLQRFVRNPNILILLLLFIGICSYYYFPLGLLFMFALITILSNKFIEESFSVENFENNNKKKNELSKKENINSDLVVDDKKKKQKKNKKLDDDDNEIDDGYDDNYDEIDDDNLIIPKKKKDKDEIIEKEEDFEDTRQNLFTKMLNIDLEDMKNHIMKDDNSERKEEILNKINIMKNKNKNIKSNDNKNLKIPKRKFDLNKDSDMHLLNTREICKDIINRINYKYEDNDYLKKYIGSRIEEIVDLNGLLEE